MCAVFHYWSGATVITIKHLFSLILAVTPVAVRETISFQLSYSPQRSGTHHAHPLLIRAVSWLEACVVSRPVRRATTLGLVFEHLLAKYSFIVPSNTAVVSKPSERSHAAEVWNSVS